MSSKVYFRGSREQARRIIYGLGSVVTGRAPDPLGIARGVHVAVGFAALSDIKADFVRKSRGGVGEDGSKWPPLSPAYLAYQRRFGSGEKAKLKKGAGLTGQHRYGTGGKKGLLTAAQLKRWRQVYGQVLRRLSVSITVAQHSLAPGAEAAAFAAFASGGLKGAQARAAQIAWATVKKEGAKTMLGVFGYRQVEILRDTGVLLNSLSPGELTGPQSYSKPTGDGGDQQIFETISNGIIVGSTVPYAATHNYGDVKRGIPARCFLPDPVPAAWEQRWANVAVDALAVGARLAFEAGRAA